MDPKTRNDSNPGEPGKFESFPQPNTIPGGWEISAFYAPEKENFKPTEASNAAKTSSKQAPKPYEQS
ncbi:MAG: hypothetical protein AB9891_10490 [Anaerolineaceae bacterium]